MRRHKKISKGKTFAIVLLTGVVSLTAVIGGAILANKDSSNDNLVDLNETDYNYAELESTTKKQNGKLNETETTTIDYNKASTTSEVETKSTKDTGKVAENETTAVGNEDAQAVDAKISSLSFSSESTLAWPVEGNVLIEYNMENTVYFPTLDIYKCSDAIAIQSDVNTPVKAGVKGVVTAINQDEEIGTSVVMNLGNGYVITYGQLKNPEVKVGDVVQADAVIGYVSEPTKYYSVEGYNLYLKIMKDKESVDPLDFLNY